MTAHVLFPALDAERPATLAPEVMRLLREELGYAGVVFSDDLEMKAVADHYSPHELVAGSFAAGVDALLVCRSAALRGEVLEQIESLGRARLATSLARMNRLKQRFRPAVSDSGGALPPYAPHVALAQRTRRDPA
jgi:beta-N-acetylhexosaminidase